MNRITATCHYNGFNFNLDGKPVSVQEIYQAGVFCTVENAVELRKTFDKAYPVGSELYNSWNTMLDRVTHISLRNIIDYKMDVSDAMREKLIAFLCKGCHSNTRKMIRSTVTYNLTSVGSYSLMERLELVCNTQWSLTAAQDYNTDMRELRKYFTN